MLPAAWTTATYSPAGAEQAPARGDDDAAKLLDLERSEDAIPWLRLSLGGHAAPVRGLAFSADSRLLFSAGEDKSVLVWGRGEEAGESWSYRRAIYWQVQRGNRGRIDALAAGHGLIAIGGYGAMAGLGEILLIEADSGRLRASLVHEAIGHRQGIVSLAFSPDPQRPGLGSLDIDGRGLYWRPDAETGIWTPRAIQPPDREQYGVEVAELLRPYRQRSPLAMTDGGHVVLPVYRPNPNWPGTVTWQLEQVDLSSGDRQLLPGQDGVYHVGLVTALAAAPDGASLASADAAQFQAEPRHRFILWDLRGGRVESRVPRVPISFSYSGSGTLLAIGSDESAGAAGIEFWDVADPRQPARRPTTIATRASVLACALAPDGSCCAYVSGNDVVLHPLKGGEPRQLRAAVRPPLRVAFPRQPPYHRLAFGSRSRDGSVPLEHVFDTASVQLAAGEPIRESDWIAASDAAQDWSVVAQRDPQTGLESYRLGERGEARGSLPLRRTAEGVPSVWTWIPAAEGQPFAVAVGTHGSNNIYVCGLAAQGTCPILRVFRGHSAAVTSLAVSRDLRYLASASLDATIRVWPLRGLGDGDALDNRWGAGFEIRDGQLVVTAVREDGPLHLRGTRAGDVLRRLRWVDGWEESGRLRVRSAASPAAMLRSLSGVGWDTMIAFDYVRGRVEGRPFQLHPAWQQLVSLVVAENREWAYWAPTGYYDASFEGHKLFGWQVNRGVQTLPDYFLAAQLRKALERPEAMSRLLEAGSLEAAFRAARAEHPAMPHRAVADAAALLPQVAIVAPAAGERVHGPTVRVRAAITVAAGQQLAPPKAFANGVLATPLGVESEQGVPRGRQRIYAWDARLPADREILLQVFASTDAEIAGQASVLIEHRSERPSRRPRLFVASAGINRYLDPQLPRLDYAAANARETAVALSARAHTLYSPQIVSLVDEHVTRPVWTATLRGCAEELARSVTPDDVLVIFLSGHGVRDPSADSYHFITANARFQDVAARRFGDCLSFEDFSLFSHLSCRKLVILDTCHSGAIQPLRQRELKAALRILQDDLFFTLTASEGDQEAVEDRQRRMGRFTHRLVEALRGAADGHLGVADGTVTWPELVRYVQATVAADSADGPHPQYPTAGPLELLSIADYPIAVREPDRSASPIPP